ncbi:hypothetical protein F5888DRAFT_1891791 [Russula emetica]|nr:hypothetical protein F5888DRAFT_1891791 [Russula emetica]
MFSNCMVPTHSTGAQRSAPSLHDRTPTPPTTDTLPVRASSTVGCDQADIGYCVVYVHRLPVTILSQVKKKVLRKTGLSEEILYRYCTVQHGIQRSQFCRIVENNTLYRAGARIIPGDSVSAYNGYSTIRLFWRERTGSRSGGGTWGTHHACSLTDVTTWQRIQKQSPLLWDQLLPHDAGCDARGVEGGDHPHTTLKWKQQAEPSRPFCSNTVMMMLVLILGTGTNGKKLVGTYVSSHAPGARLRLLQIITIWSDNHQAINVHKHQRDVLVKNFFLPYKCQTWRPEKGKPQRRENPKWPKRAIGGSRVDFEHCTINSRGYVDSALLWCNTSLYAGFCGHQAL